VLDDQRTASDPLVMEAMKGDGEVGDAVKESVLSRDDHCRDG
jgi:hypothetical protein